MQYGHFPGGTAEVQAAQARSCVDQEFGKGGRRSFARRRSVGNHASTRGKRCHKSEASAPVYINEPGSSMRAATKSIAWVSVCEHQAVTASLPT